MGNKNTFISGVIKCGIPPSASIKKIAFLCSRKCPSNIILKSYDWAIEQREKGICVVSGFHSQIEKDVFHYLLKGTQPIILVLARGMKKKFEPEVKKALDDQRLLVVSPFKESVKRVTSENAIIRNRVMAEFADEVVIAHAESGGKLESLIEELSTSKTPIIRI